MLVIVLSVILQSASLLGKPALFRGATQPPPASSNLRGLSPEARSVKEYCDTEKSLKKVWEKNAKLRTSLGTQFLDAKTPSHEAQSVRTPTECSGEAKKCSPPVGTRCGIFTCCSNLIPKAWLERAQREHILDDEIELVHLLTQAYHRLKDGNVAGATKYVGRAEKIQANLELLESSFPSIHLLENDRYRRGFEKFIHAQHHFSNLLARVKLAEALQKLAKDRIAIAQRWSQPRVPSGQTTPQSPLRKIMNWLSGSRKKNIAIQAAVRAARTEMKAWRARRQGDYVKARRNISTAQHLQAEAERLRAQIPDASEAIINLMDLPEYRITTKHLRRPYMIDQIMQSRLNLGFEIIKREPPGMRMEPVGQDLIRRGWLIRFAFYLFGRT